MCTQGISLSRRSVAQENGQSIVEEPVARWVRKQETEGQGRGGAGEHMRSIPYEGKVSEPLRRGVENQLAWLGGASEGKASAKRLGP